MEVVKFGEQFWAELNLTNFKLLHDAPLAKVYKCVWTQRKGLLMMPKNDENGDENDEDGLMKVVAVKIMRDDPSSRSECEMLRKVSGHPSIVGFEFTVASHGAQILGMELCCKDLFHLFYEKQVSLVMIQYYGAQIANALHYLHSEMSVTFGDLKPENVFLNEHGQIKLGDFGMSFKNGEGALVKGQGTLQYASPEIFKREDCTVSCDWWSFGVLIYEMCFERLPWDYREDEDSTVDANKVCERICRDPLPVPFSN